jgi:hypothetical protein
MGINYTRNPSFTTPIANVPYWSLSQLSSNEVKNVITTDLHMRIHTTNTCTKITSNYSLSSSLQLQKFQINSNKFDKMGISYGEVDGSSNSYVFGPQGHVVTTQPYVRRKLWDAATDVEYTHISHGTSHQKLLSGQGNAQGTGDSVWGYCGDIGSPYGEYLYDAIDLSIDPFYPIFTISNSVDTYKILGGSYNTSAENGFGDNVAGLARLITFIETNCARLSSAANMWGVRWELTNPTASNGWSSHQEADKVPNNPYYSTSFHDYT